MIRFIALGLFLSCAMIAAQIYFKDEIAGTVNIDSDNPRATQSAVTSVAPDLRLTPAIEDITNDDQQYSKETGSNIASPSPEPNELWLSDSSDRPIPIRYQRNGLIPEPLKFNHQQVKTLNIGDHLSLSIPQTGQAYDIEIQRVTKHQNGTRTLTAEITNTPMPYRVVVTEGPKTTFATINTPEGTFSLDAAGEEAWLVSQQDLDRLIDPNFLDYQIPDMHL